jgi:hypothetical protein
MTNYIDWFEYMISGDWVTSGEDVQYRISEINGRQVVSFQGSVSKSDWRHNFDIAIQPYKNMNIKWFAWRGYVKLWKSVQDEIMEKLDPNVPPLFLGYSQGGGIATLAHEDYVYRHGVNPNTITIGAPPVVWRTHRIKNRFHSLVEIRNPTDLVVFLPTIFGYQHTGEIRVLQGRARRPKTCSKLLWFSGHSQDEYRQRLLREVVV